ncbi:MAG: IclR family transcriptional regulator C-terminal domain-containing protein [Pseudomonadota bacterium]
MPKPINRNISTTFVKGIQVLKAFDDDNTHLTQADLAARTGLDRASVRRLVLTLVELGYVRHSGRNFVLTPQILTLAGSFFQGNAIGVEIQPLLNRYSERIAGPTSLALRDGERAIYVCQSAARAQPVTFGFTVGSRLPLTHSAIGRMILAWDDQAWAKTFLRSTEIKPYTSASLTDRADIAGAVETARSQGYAIVVDEFEAGVTGLAVPIGPKGAPSAVVGTSISSKEAAKGRRRKDILAGLCDLAGEMGHTRMFRSS